MYNQASLFVLGLYRQQYVLISCVSTILNAGHSRMCNSGFITHVDDSVQEFNISIANGDTAVLL